jgi:hypothetical protein
MQRFNRAHLAAILLFTLFCALYADSIVKQPPVGTFKMREELKGKHPRLYFTAKDIPLIRRNAKGPNKWFVDRLKKSFGGYYGKDVESNMPGWRQ